jgi:competence protein ComEC
MRERLPRWVMPLFTLVLSSVVAGLATAPFAAAHFNRFTDYGLLANLLTVPMMSVLMAAGAMAALLAPFGLAMPALWLMELAARWILFVAYWIAGLEGAVTPIPAPGPWAVPLIAAAGVWAVLMRGRAQACAALPLLAGLGLWALAERPVLLISSDGRLAGLMGDEGRALSAKTGAGFTATNWLEKDGDLAPQAVAFDRAGFSGPRGARAFDFQPPGSAGAGNLRGIVLMDEERDLAAACAEVDLVIVPGRVAGTAPEGCALIDAGLLRRTGALALWHRSGAWEFEPAARGARIWMGAKEPPVLPSLQAGKTRPPVTAAAAAPGLGGQ